MILRKKWKTLLSILIVFCMISGGLYYLTGLTERKQAKERNQELYDRGSEYDVLFVGSSHVVEGIYPMEIWDDYGITSYNVGRYGHYMAGMYYALEDALKYTKPKLVVIDVLNIEGEVKARTDENGIKQIHATMDTIPLSFSKIKAVKDLYPDDKDIQKEFLFKYILYHNRWEELGMDDFQVLHSAEKGAVTRTEIAEPIPYQRITRDQVCAENTVGVEYLKKMVDMCSLRDIDVLLVFLPYPADDKDQEGANRAYRFAQENDIPYINFLDTQVCDFQTDLHDEDSHLNALGAKKISAYLGNYIQQNYQIRDHRGEAEYEEWNNDNAEYRDLKIEYLEQQTELKNYLMLCNDSDYYVKVVMNPDLMIMNDDAIRRLLDGLDSVVVTDADLGEGIQIYVQVEDCVTGEVLTTKSFAEDVQVLESAEKD